MVQIQTRFQNGSLPTEEGKASGEDKVVNGTAAEGKAKTQQVPILLMHSWSRRG